jgi:hypothetical protein
MKARAFAFSSVLLLGACDKEQPKPAPKSVASSAASAEPVAEKPRVPSKPSLSLDDSGAMISGERVDLTVPDAKLRVFGALAGKPGVEGQTVELDVPRKVLTSRVMAFVAGLRQAKAKGVTIKTMNRERATVDLEFSLATRPADCSAVGHIGKDRSIVAWPMAGGGATRYAKGMAGPDMTLGSAGVRKVAQACDSPVWIVSADDSVEWGLAFDLALAVRKGDDAAPVRAPGLSLPHETPVPGRKVAWP